MAKTVSGYYVANGAIVSMHRKVEGKVPENFIVSGNLDDKVLRVSADGKSIEVVANSIGEVMTRYREEAKMRFKK